METSMFLRIMKILMICDAHICYILCYDLKKVVGLIVSVYWKLNVQMLLIH